MADESRPIQLRRRGAASATGAPAPSSSASVATSDRPRWVAELALAAALAVTSAGIGAAVVRNLDDDEPAGPTAADAIAGELPPGYVVVGVLENDVRYELTAAAPAVPADRFVVTIYRRFDAPADLPRRVVNGDELWTGYDLPDLRAIYLRAADGVGLRVSHQGPTDQTLADLTAIARTLGTDPIVVREARP